MDLLIKWLSSPSQTRQTVTCNCHMCWDNGQPITSLEGQSEKTVNQSLHLKDTQRKDSRFGLVAQESHQGLVEICANFRVLFEKNNLSEVCLVSSVCDLWLFTSAVVCSVYKVANWAVTDCLDVYEMWQKMLVWYVTPGPTGTMETMEWNVQVCSVSSGSRVPWRSPVSCCHHVEHRNWFWTLP